MSRNFEWDHFWLNLNHLTNQRVPLLSVLLPVYNELSTLHEILKRVQAVPVDKEIIIVDNVSTDGTREALQTMLDQGLAGEENSRHPVRIAFQSVNLGKGSSVKRALALARGEWILVQDADLEYDPADYLRLFQKALPPGKPPLDVVFGNRLEPGSTTLASMPKTSFFYGRMALSMLFRIIYATPLTDPATCYKLMRRDFAQKLQLRSDGFNLDFELAAKVAKAHWKGARVAEIPISYNPRTELEGKKIKAFHDGWRALWAFIVFRVGN